MALRFNDRRTTALAILLCFLFHLSPTLAQDSLAQIGGSVDLGRRGKVMLHHNASVISIGLDSTGVGLFDAFFASLSMILVSEVSLTTPPYVAFVAKFWQSIYSWFYCSSVDAFSLDSTWILRTMCFLRFYCITWALLERLGCKLLIAGSSRGLEVLIIIGERAREIWGVSVGRCNWCWLNELKHVIQSRFAGSMLNWRV